MNGTIVPLEPRRAARKSARDGERLVCTAEMADATPNLMLCACVLWVGWWSGTGRTVWTRADLRAAVADYFAAASARWGEPVDRAEDLDSADWLIDRALATPGTPLRRLP